jgi:hypothetical protein
VRGVGDELALERERALEPVEQLVEGIRELLELVVGRSCKLVAEITFVVAVIVRSGRRNRPATSQPTPSETKAMIASAIAEAISS